MLFRSIAFRQTYKGVPVGLNEFFKICEIPGNLRLIEKRTFKGAYQTDTTVVLLPVSHNSETGNLTYKNNFLYFISVTLHMNQTPNIIVINNSAIYFGEEIS